RSTCWLLHSTLLPYTTLFRSDLQLADSFFGIETGINPLILEDDDKGRAYLRGAFLATGTIRDPESGKYQLEIFSVYQDHAEDLANLMRKFILDAKVIEHKSGAVTYLQKADRKSTRLN